MLIFPVYFAIMVGIKGGLLGKIADALGKKLQWKAFRKNKIIDFIFDGNFLSAVLSGIFVGHYTTWLVGLLFAGAWFIGWIVSLGEEIGAIGRFGKNWGPYVDWLGAKAGRIFGWKKGLQRGVFLGACLSLAMYSVPFNELLIITCTLFPLIYFIGNDLYYRVHKADSWFYSELLIGGAIGTVLKILIG